MAHRGDHEVLTTAPGEQLDNPYSLNTVDVCPVGALTAKDFRFTMRAWELDATPSVCNGCATGCNIEIHHSRGTLWRLVPRDNPDVNKHWMCDEGRFTYKRVARAAPRRAARRRPARRVGPRARRRRRAAARGARRRRRPRSAWCSTRSRPTRTTSRSPSWLRAPRASARRTWPASTRAGSDDILRQRRREPEHRRRDGDRRRRGCARCSTWRTTSSRARVDDAAGRRHATACSATRRGPAALPLDKLEALVVIGTHRDAVADAAHGRAAARRVGRGRRHVHQPTGHGAAHARRRRRRPARRCPAGRSSSHLGAQARRHAWTAPSAKAVFAEAKSEAAVHEGRRLGTRCMLPVQLRFAGLARLDRRWTTASLGFHVVAGAHQDRCS